MNVLNTPDAPHPGDAPRLAAAVLDGAGTLIDINRGFLRCWQPAPPGCPAATPVTGVFDRPGPETQRGVRFKPAGKTDHTQAVAWVHLPASRGAAIPHEVDPPKEAED